MKKKPNRDIVKPKLNPFKEKLKKKEKIKKEVEKGIFRKRYNETEFYQELYDFLVEGSLKDPAKRVAKEKSRGTRGRTGKYTDSFIKPSKYPHSPYRVGEGGRIVVRKKKEIAGPKGKLPDSKKVKEESMNFYQELYNFLVEGFFEYPNVEKVKKQSSTLQNIVSKLEKRKKVKGSSEEPLSGASRIYKRIKRQPYTNEKTEFYQELYDFLVEGSLSIKRAERVGTYKQEKKSNLSRRERLGKIAKFPNIDAETFRKRMHSARRRNWKFPKQQTMGWRKPNTLTKLEAKWRSEHRKRAKKPLYMAGPKGKLPESNFYQELYNLLLEYDPRKVWKRDELSAKEKEGLAAAKRQVTLDSLKLKDRTKVSPLKKVRKAARRAGNRGIGGGDMLRVKSTQSTHTHPKVGGPKGKLPESNFYQELYNFLVEGSLKDPAKRAAREKYRVGPKLGRDSFFSSGREKRGLARRLRKTSKYPDGLVTYGKHGAITGTNPSFIPPEKIDREINKEFKIKRRIAGPKGKLPK